MPARQRAVGGESLLKQSCVRMTLHMTISYWRPVPDCAHKSPSSCGELPLQTMPPNRFTDFTPVSLHCSHFGIQPTARFDKCSHMLDGWELP